MIRLKTIRFIHLLNWRLFGKIWLFVGFIFFFCEILIYYIVLLQCTWPQIKTQMPHSTVKVMLLADTHLLGPRFGHWFDKLRREWQMYRAFQTAMTLHNPQVIFILGDLFDEGFHCSEKEFNAYIKRFHSLFSVSENTKLYAVIGNHDIGFHYRIQPQILQRFEKTFNTSSVELITIRGNHFVLVNSMAMQGDSCFLCQPAQLQLKKISDFLKCAKLKGASSNCQKYESLPIYSAPILLQHFPLYRESDSHCKEPDAAPPEVATELFRQTWDCLSKDSTQMILQMLQPRAAFSGHTHHGCVTAHDKMIEWTLPSFSWRNKDAPSFTLAVFAPDNFEVSKCGMPRETTVMYLYIFGLVLLIWLCCSHRTFFVQKVK